MKKHTQLYYARKYLMRGERLTQPFFSERHGGWRLAVSIGILRNKYGWKIETKMVKTAERNRPIGLYRISEEEKNRLKTEGLLTTKSTAQESKGIKQ